VGKKLISIRLDERLLKEIESFSKFWERNRTKMIEELLKEGLRRKKRKALIAISAVYILSSAVLLAMYLLHTSYYIIF